MEGRRLISWLKTDEAVPVAMELREGGRVIVRWAPVVDDAMARAREELESEYEGDKLDDHLLGLSLRFVGGLVEPSGRMTLDSSVLSHLKAETENDQVYVICNARRFELWSLDFFDRFFNKFSESQDLQFNEDPQQLRMMFGQTPRKVSPVEE